MAEKEKIYEKCPKAPEGLSHHWDIPKMPRKNDEGVLYYPGKCRFCGAEKNFTGDSTEWIYGNSRGDVNERRRKNKERLQRGGEKGGSASRRTSPRPQRPEEPALP